MGFLDCAGYTMIAFGPSLALFILVIARDPLRIILFVLGAFFWLMSLLVSALLWFIVVPLREYLVFGLVFSVLFQEVFRLLFFMLLRKAQTGLDKISASGMEIAGVHSLKHARHTVAMVSGLGFGFMSGLFALVNVLADSKGPGIPGFPESFRSSRKNSSLVDSDDIHPDSHFFLTSSLMTSAMILLHVMWTVVFWNSCHSSVQKTRVLGLAVPLVVAGHAVVSGLSFLNKLKLTYVSLPVTYIILLIFTVCAFCASGGSWKSITKLVSLRSSDGRTIVEDNRNKNT